MGMDFTGAHPRSLENCLKWLRQMRAQIDCEISTVETHLAAEKASAERQKVFNALAQDLISESLTKAGVITRLRSMGFPEARVVEAAKVWKRLTGRRRREFRDAEIVRRMMLNDAGTAAALSEQYGISRKQVYVIFKKANPLKRGFTA